MAKDDSGALHPSAYTFLRFRMSDPVLSLLLLICFPFAALLARYFKSLESDGWDAARAPIVAGAVAGVALRFVHEAPVPWAVMAGVLLTAAAWYARMMGHESEPVDGMLLGSLAGAAAAVPLVIDSQDPCSAVASCIAAGAAAGYGLPYAALHTASKSRRLLDDLVTAAAAVAAAWLPAYLKAERGIDSVTLAIAVASSIPLLAIATVFVQWPQVRHELRDEAAHGFLSEDDVRLTAHPLLRLGSGGWNNAEAHRQYVRLANKIALRKRQQRGRRENLARIYQLEIMKLRMQMQQMNDAGRLAVVSTQIPDFSSDRMTGSE